MVEGDKVDLATGGTAKGIFACQWCVHFSPTITASWLGSHHGSPHNNPQKSHERAGDALAVPVMPNSPPRRATLMMII